MRRLWICIGFGLLVAVYTAVIAGRTSMAAGGSDSSGYLNEARLMTQGRASIPLTPLRNLHIGGDWAWVFTPLGFRPSLDSHSIVPTYPPGWPVQLAAAALAGGWQRLPFVLAPLSAGVTLLLMFLFALQLGLEEWLAVAAAAILAVSPVFIMFALQPVTDVVATSWVLAAMVAALASERRAGWAVAAGVAFAVSVCVRPADVLLAIPLLFALKLRPRAIAIAAVSALPIGIALALWQNALYGSPFRTGYGDAAPLLSWRNLPTHVPHYAFWLAVLLTPFIFPGGLFIAADRRAPRTMLLSWFAVFFVFYCFYGPYETWWYTRFLLPAFPPLIAGFLLLVRRKRAVAAVLIAVVLAVGVFASRRFSVLSFGEGESVYPEAVLGSERILPRDAIVISMQMSGAFLYYSGRLTVRWDNLDNDRFQLLRAYAGAANLHWYALLADFELEDMKGRLKGTWTPIARFRDVTLYRLDS
ncbi:MAG TPA: hypothetical protein VKH35_11845 [Thermoanaerobaculia bacterium]|nr:hypothetical protein [Thermoanaerobaculia bacterium]